MHQNEDEGIARKAVRGRGTGELAKGRFERLQTTHEQTEAGQVETQVFRDSTRTIISTNDSPDVGMDTTVNPYRGCEHGCIYCYARPTHEYLGLSAGLDFETRIFAKFEAPALLRAELEKKSWRPRTIVFSGVTDCYQPIERKLEITRNCLKVLAEFRNPVAIITKNTLVTRDIDILSELARFDAAHVVLSITSINRETSRRMEPRAATPDQRFRAVAELTAAGIPVSVNMAPIVPGLTDHEIPELLRRSAEAGARSAHYNLVRLPYGVKDLFQTWLDENFPDRKEKILNRIRAIRGGVLNRSEFGKRMEGEGVFADQIDDLFQTARKRYGLNKPSRPLSAAHFRKPEKALPLFESLTSPAQP